MSNTDAAARIAVLIPCLNEASTIAKVVSDFRRALPDATVYVGDNASTDDTALMAAEAGATVLGEPLRGKGNVVRRMFRTIDADVYVLVDGDDTYDASAAPLLVAPIATGQADMVTADRLSSTYFSENKRPFHNCGNRLVRSMINFIFGARLHDIMSGYRALSRDFVKNFPVMTRGFELETEMTIHALDKGYAIAEIATPYRDRPAHSVSKLNTFGDGTRVICTIFSLFRRYRPMAFFSTLALLSFVAGMVLIVPVLVEYWHTGLVPRFPSLIVACTFVLLALLLYICGLILSTVSYNHRQVFELFRLHTRP